MLDLGFASDVLSIARSIRPDRQTLMFSATMQSEVERLANEITKRAVRVTIGTEGQVGAGVIDSRNTMRCCAGVIPNYNVLFFIRSFRLLV